MTKPEVERVVVCCVVPVGWQVAARWVVELSDTLLESEVFRDMGIAAGERPTGIKESRPVDSPNDATLLEYANEAADTLFSAVSIARTSVLRPVLSKLKRGCTITTLPEPLEAVFVACIPLLLQALVGYSTWSAYLHHLSNFDAAGSSNAIESSLWIELLTGIVSWAVEMDTMLMVSEVTPPGDVAALAALNSACLRLFGNLGSGGELVDQIRLPGIQHVYSGVANEIPTMFLDLFADIAAFCVANLGGRTSCAPVPLSMTTTIPLVDVVAPSTSSSSTTTITLHTPSWAAGETGGMLWLAACSVAAALGVWATNKKTSSLFGQLVHGSTVVELGCGGGVFGISLATRFKPASVFLTDFSPAVVEALQERTLPTLGASAVSVVSVHELDFDKYLLADGQRVDEGGGSTVAVPRNEAAVEVSSNSGIPLDVDIVVGTEIVYDSTFPGRVAAALRRIVREAEKAKCQKGNTSKPTYFIVACQDQYEGVSEFRAALREVGGFMPCEIAVVPLVRPWVRRPEGIAGCSAQASMLHEPRWEVLESVDPVLRHLFDGKEGSLAGDALSYAPVVFYPELQSSVSLFVGVAQRQESNH